MFTAVCLANATTRHIAQPIPEPGKPINPTPAAWSDRRLAYYSANPLCLPNGAGTMLLVQEVFTFEDPL
ncbi:hypothetical protein H257_02929 [Aphanomyces astaci]|uniref:Uncharacterized protein n=1 Tax=Aphanomyces astaci TaxID=112090 RepID=W4GZJ0_APHAT|nr:hypothetical protein H257_02929 [Aphanomyces astaci]ETV85052.1 hypothetical protein H257_02929 [Aphanomyces astaci]|eukprot:XP_009825070.1 hypothetical protein H257_02929 [Aphanomyces astaci]